jgi:hypothetical protein
MSTALSSSIKFAVVAALLLVSASTVIARTHVAPGARHGQVVRHSPPGYGSDGPFSGKSHSGDAWIYENNHYLQMLPH